MNIKNTDSIFSYIDRYKLEIIKIAVYAFFLSIVITLFYTSMALNKNIVSRKEENNELYKSLITQRELIESLENQLYKREQVIMNLNEIILSQSDALEFIQKPNLKIVKLHDYRNKVMDEGKLLLDLPNKKAVLLAKNMRKLPDGQTYQLWAYIGSDPVSLGTFQPDDKGNAILKIEYLPNPTDIIRYAVTSEPVDGSPGPTGEMYLLGSI